MNRLERLTLACVSALFICSAAIISPASAILDERFFSSNGIDLYDDECQDVSAAGAVILAGDDVEQKILNFFMQKGLSLAQASAFVGNMMVESGLKPNIREGGQLVDENYTPENGVGFGLVQWTFSARQKPLVEFTKGMGVPVADLGGQLGFVWQELNSGQWLKTLNKVRATDDPVEAAVIVHDEYEVSADSPAKVRQVRGGNAQKVFDKYRDAPALAGAGAEDALQNPGGSPDGPASTPAQPSKEKKNDCKSAGFAGGNFNETLKHYAWNEWKGMTTEATQEYQDATARARGEGLYVGGISSPGIDCGGFVTLLIRDSGYDKGYNYNGKGGPTSTQEQWARQNWQSLGSSGSIDVSTLQPGDVAINNGHTFIYVGDVEGFESEIASASLDERAPMADTAQQANQPGFNWYRKK